jgi:putative N6-adenine-specific DNA methylase
MKTYEASKNISCAIVATDIESTMIDATYENAELAGIDKLIKCDVCDFMLTPVPETTERGTIIMNPPYGGRMGDPLRLRDTYTGMGIFLQQHKASYDGFIFTGNPELAENSGLESGHPQTFYSGRIECSLLENPTVKPEDEARFLRRSAVR